MAAILKGFAALAFNANETEKRTIMTTHTIFFMVRPPFRVKDNIWFAGCSPAIGFSLISSF